jgi:hypothetical protein
VNAGVLVRDLEQQGVRLYVKGDQLVVDAPKGVLTTAIRSALASEKPAVVQLLTAGEHQQRLHPPRARGRPLAEVAADLAPAVRLTIRETGDTERDFDLLGRVRKVIQEFQPGGNHVYLKIVTTDGRRVVVEWRAVAARDLRMAIAQVLARAALQDKADIHAR